MSQNGSDTQHFCAQYTAGMIRMIGVDVDGTLVGTDNVVRDDVWQALAQARTKGLRLSICSGRPALGHALTYAQRIDAEGWHIFQNGASIVNVQTGESLSEPFPAHLLPELLQLAEQNGWLLELYSDKQWAVSQKSDYARRHAALLGIDYNPCEISQLTSAPVRAQWVIPQADAERVLAYPHTGLSLHPAGSPAMPDVTFISLTLAGVDKGSALRRIAAQYTLDMNEVLMVGDGENDIPALQAAGHSIAMGNAEALVKQVAQHTVSHVDEGGLKEAIAWALAQNIPLT